MKLSKQEIRTRALKAAAGVALFTGALSCGEVPTSTLEERTTSELADPRAVPDAGLDPTNSPELDAGSVFDSGEVFDSAEIADAGVTLADAGAPVDVGSLEECTGLGDDWFACCERIGWDWNRGCQAWGPPVPPALSGEVA